MSNYLQFFVSNPVLKLILKVPQLHESAPVFPKKKKQNKKRILLSKGVFQCIFLFLVCL